MEDVLDKLLFDDDPSPEQRAEVRQCLDENPELADAWAHWRQARAHVRQRVKEHVPDRRLLVLYVLDQKGEYEAMTPSERSAVDDARDDIASALDELSALEEVVERIRDECDDFDEVWSTHAEDVGRASDGAATSDGRAGDAVSKRADRAPRRPESGSASRTRRWIPRLAMAVAVIGVAVAAVLYWPQDSTTVTVADGSLRTLTLNDGTTVRVVGSATLTYPETFDEDDPRRVTLESGRAFFDVQRRPDGPSFVVNTPTATASVLGTQFGVSATTDTTEVVLASGSVEVGGADGEGGAGVILEPGQKSWVAKGAAPASPTPTDVTAALDWTGLFVFRSTSLAAISDQLSRRYDVQVAVDEALSGERVTGTFEQEQPVRQVLDALATTLGAEVERTDNRYRLVPAE